MSEMKEKDLAGDVTRATVRASMWTVAARWAVRGLSLASTIILARLLAPSDFGTLVVAILVAGLLDACSQFGFNELLIQKQTDDEAYYHTAWTLNAIRGLLIFLILVLIAPSAAAFMNEPNATGLIYAVSFISLLDGFGSTKIITIQRDFKFSIYFTLQTAEKVLTFILTIGAAYVLHSYYAFAFGLVAGGIFRLVTSYIVAPMKIRLSFLHFGEVFQFSRWIIASNILLYFSQNWDAAIVGKNLSADQLGLYKVSKDIAIIPAAETMGPLSVALFPAFAHLRNDIEGMRTLFYRWQSATHYILIPAIVGIALTANELVPVMLGDKWLAATLSIKIVSIAYAVNVFWLWPTPIYSAIGRPNLALYERVISVLAVLVMVTLGVYYFGLLGASSALIAANIITASAQYVMLRRIMKISIQETFVQNWRAYVGLAALIVAVQSVAGPQNAVLLLSLKVVIGVLVYAAVCFLLWLLRGRPSGFEALALDLSAKFFTRLGLRPRAL
ncbi:oligosaccharide flippase family protein [Oryzifoliimicrobium ureilyticus]|uniref:oligosaccharide flippase family protein n=1 Tax=Oryzifoliimicrobium ureilyticus TaxID=3113724 RepID=UPI003075F321